MSPAVFLDANVPIYAAGGDHPLKEPCAQILRTVAEDPRPFVTDSEVLQELLHRYLALSRWELGREVLRAFAEAMQGRIEPVHSEDILDASKLADRHPTVSARDLVHAAVMQRVGADRIISADTDFDQLEGIDRLDPTSVSQMETPSKEKQQ
ncbi:MAG: type II toxin-antitoxin system VapC family toxin [Chloroflexota bacterium]|nr:type II toxin-antitoxin system VapC family toxin [Chloroflexota bacterium]